MTKTKAQCGMYYVGFRKGFLQHIIFKDQKEKWNRSLNILCSEKNTLILAHNFGKYIYIFISTQVVDNKQYEKKKTKTK